MVPTVGSFFTPLKLADAFREYDAYFHLSRRRYVQPNFAELRHILNIAQVHASADALRLITFDADGTLYADGHHIEQDSEMIRLFVSLMRLGVHVAIVTAAGYPGDAAKFEGRIAGLLAAFQRLKLPKDVVQRFHLMGGECNYLLDVDPDAYHLRFVPDEAWQVIQCSAALVCFLFILLQNVQITKSKTTCSRAPHPTPSPLNNKQNRPLRCARGTRARSRARSTRRRPYWSTAPRGSCCRSPSSASRARSASSR
jgi:hypothetical protein